MDQTAEYTYLTIPEGSDPRSCLGVVLAGLTTLARIGVGGLDEAIEALEKAHANGSTSYRFALWEGKILVQSEIPRNRSSQEQEKDGASAGWRTLVELVS